EDITKRLRCWHKDDNSLRKKHKSKEHTTKTRLPLPGKVLDMFTEEDDDPQSVDSIQHGGRIRSFKHERGNWAAYVYFPYIPEEGFLELLDEMTKVAGSNGISLTHTDKFHLSLSKTVVLRHHWIQSFIQSLRTGLAHVIEIFFSLAEKLKVYSNDDKTRYSRISYHDDLTWCVGDCTEHIRKECLQDLQGLVDSHEDGAFLLRLDCQELQCKSGNKTFCFPLH
uniref:U6 snRNA phosphodiesterase 1 n=1 Tax=Hucho hucho TaxID=62062 RepID=A0A4W5MUV4_9TELE